MNLLDEQVDCDLSNSNMVIESECNSDEKFLIIEAVFSKEAIKASQEKSQQKVPKKLRSSYYYQFLNWKKNKDEAALFTAYAYAYMDLPIEYDCLFQVQNPEDHILTPMLVSQSIWEGYYPIGQIEDGHKHLCVFSFLNGIPAVIHELHVVYDDFASFPVNSLTLGACKYQDYKSIKEKIISE